MNGNIVNGIISEERRYADIPYQESGTNHQIFSDIVNSYGLAGCQDQAWCATYQFAMELINVGKAQALKNWNMSEGTYCGYNCFKTEAKFGAAGKTGSTPKVGALVIFKRSHMGRVLSVNNNKKTFECGEGNTSSQRFNRDGDCCAVKSYSWYDTGISSFCYIDYGDIMLTNAKVLQATKAVYEMAHNGGYTYGDSHSIPPCADHKISCDRLPARALYNLGMTDQPAGGFTVLNADAWLTAHGFKKITNARDLAVGDIVLMKQNGTSGPTAAWHMYVVAAVNSDGTIDKYDMGSNDRIRSAQPFRHVPVNEWPTTRTFYAAYRVKDDKPTHVELKPIKLLKNTQSIYSYLATEILKARGYKGRIVDGDHKELELNTKWSTSDMAALAHYRADRIDRDVWSMGQGSGAGECDSIAWTDMLGHSIPWTLPLIPAEEKEGNAVLLAQEILRARGMRGVDGQPIGLDRQWGANTRNAVCQFQKAMGLRATGVIDYTTWKYMLGL